MRILFINSLYYPNQIGGAEVSLQIMAEELVSRGNEVYVLSLDNKTYAEKHNGVVSVYVKTRNIYTIGNHQDQPILKKAIWHMLDSNNPLYNHQLRRIIRYIHPDIINTNNIQGFSPAIWRLIKKENINLVHTIRDYYLMCMKTTMFDNEKNCKKLCSSCERTYNKKKIFFNYPDAFIGISEFVKSKHQEYNLGTNKPFYVVGNGVHVSGELSFKNPDKVIVLGFIGKVVFGKGIEYMLKELRKIKTGHQFKILIAGDATRIYRKRLEKTFSKTLDLQFIGKVASSDFFKMIDVVIVPSEWNEPFGRVPIEAVNNHTPVCVAKKAGLAELYNSSCMWQFEMKSRSLMELVCHILEHPWEINQKSLTCKEEKLKFDASDVASKTEEILKLIVENKSNALTAI